MIKAGFAPEKCVFAAGQITGDISRGILFNRSSDPPHQHIAFVRAAWYFAYAGTPVRSVKGPSHLRFMVFCELTQRRN